MTRLDQPVGDQSTAGAAEDPATRTSLGTVSGPVPPVVGHRRGLVLAALGYFVVSMVLWANVWTSHPTSTTTCGCGDSSLFTWFLEWPAYAISHGLDPLYSTALFHPTGVNLLANTAEFGIGVVLAPVSWLFGPVATLNVALTVAPLLSALAMFVLARRWARWQPAAFAAGLLYGFSPFIVIALTDGHLMLGMAPIPPLMVLCLDELFIRQRRSPAKVGIALGLLVAVQFFIGTELLVLIALAVAIGTFLAFVYFGLRHSDGLRERVRPAVTGLVAAGITAGVLLVVPAWFALAGTAHLSGPVWGPKALISYGGTDLRDYLLPHGPYPTLINRRFGGYQGVLVSDQYLGIGLLGVLAAGTLVWRRDRRLWLFGAVGLVSVPLSFGLHLNGQWTLWRLFVRFPEMENIIPSRFLVITYLCAAAMLGIIIDRTHAAVQQRNAAGRQRNATARSDRRPGAPDSRPRWAAAIAGTAVAAVALVPIGAYFAGSVPLVAVPVRLPTWFATQGHHLPPHQVVLVLPAPFSLRQSAMTWQAVDQMSFAMVGGGGPGALLARAGAERSAQVVLTNVSVSDGQGSVTAAQVQAVHTAVAGWGVTMAVVPNTAGLPAYERFHEVRTATVLLTAATGRQPVYQHDAWVWTGLSRAAPSVSASDAQLARCDAGPERSSPASIQASAACVTAIPASDR